MNIIVDVLNTKIESLLTNEIKSVQNDVLNCVKSNLLNGEEIIQTKKNQKRILGKIEKIENRLEGMSQAKTNLEEDFLQFKEEIEISMDKTQKSNEKLWELIDTSDRKVSFLDFTFNDYLDDYNTRLKLASDNLSLTSLFQLIQYL